jgi:hypothetical protein
MRGALRPHERSSDITAMSRIFVDTRHRPGYHIRLTNPDSPRFLTTALVRCWLNPRHEARQGSRALPVSKGSTQTRMDGTRKGRISLRTRKVCE